MRVKETKKKVCYYENNFDLADKLKRSQGPPGVPGPHFGNHCCDPREQKQAEKGAEFGMMVLVSLPWKMGRRKQGGKTPPFDPEVPLLSGVD